MNAGQRRKFARRVWGDHFRWPLGTRVEVLPGHHSPEAVGLIGKISKHGRPCTHRVNCIVDFAQPVMDRTFGTPPGARFGHYVDFRNLRKVSR